MEQQCRAAPCASRAMRRMHARHGQCKPGTDNAPLGNLASSSTSARMLRGFSAMRSSTGWLSSKLIFVQSMASLSYLMTRRRRRWCRRSELQAHACAKCTTRTHAHARTHARTLRPTSRRTCIQQKMCTRHKRIPTSASARAQPYSACSILKMCCTKNCCKFSLQKLMHNCSNEFTPKFSNPKMSRTPMDVRKDFWSSFAL